MLIEVNTDHNIRGTLNLIVHVKGIVQDRLSVFSNDITRVVVNFSDKNASKNGVDDKRCTIEARIEHMKPVAVTCDSNNLILSLDNACDKLNRLLKTIITKRRDNRPDLYAIDLMISNKLASEFYSDETRS